MSSTQSMEDFNLKSLEDDIKNVKKNLDTINANIKKAYESVPNNPFRYPNLLAVSKLKPKELIIEAYRHGQRHFGENYVQELFDKATDSEINEKCPDIKWHMIGHLQTNKINKLLTVPNLFQIQTVDSIKVAEHLNSAINRNQNIQGKINVLAQINTSEEEEKSGIYASEAIDLVSFILEKCDRLQLRGLMTIGAYGYDVSHGPNPDFLKLLDVKKKVCEKFNISEIEIEISMGMTSDYEHAIHLGSTMVRLGTAIFGERWKKLKKKLYENSNN